jgi:DNA-binding protein HU-beta
VNRTELIEYVAMNSDISKAVASRVLNGILTTVTETLQKGEVVSLLGFGSFSVGKRAARVGRNPRTGAAIKIKATKVLKFRSGKLLKDAVNK